MFYAGTEPPASMNVHFVWKSENSFNSNRGFSFMMWIAMPTIVAIIISIVVQSMHETAEEIMKQQFKQPIKSEKAD